jgi:hypothetical protein
MMVGYFDYFVKVPERASVNVAQKILDSYLGEYEVFPGRTITVTKSADGLMMSSGGLPAVPLFAETETKFFLKLSDVQLTFIKNEEGDAAEMIPDQGGREFRAKRLRKSVSRSENK